MSQVSCIPASEKLTVNLITKWYLVISINEVSVRCRRRKVEKVIKPNTDVYSSLVFFWLSNPST